MLDRDQKKVWDEVKALWNNAAGADKITIKVDFLIEELKSKVSSFEKEAIKHDIERIKNATSQFEKESIERDLQLFTRSIKQFIKRLKGKE